MIYILRLTKDIKYSFTLLALLFLAPMDINAELTEDQKSLFDILIILKLVMTIRLNLQFKTVCLQTCNLMQEALMTLYIEILMKI